jgi:hypothetical protein
VSNLRAAAAKSSSQRQASIMQQYTYRRFLQAFSKGVRYSSAIRSTFINPANAQQQPRSDNNFGGLRLNL